MDKDRDTPRRPKETENGPDKSKSRQSRTPTPIERAEAEKEDHVARREGLPLPREDGDAKSVDGQHDRADRRN